MITKRIKVHIDAPLDYAAALAALTKIQEGIRDLAAVLRKKTRRKGSPGKRDVFRKPRK